MEVANINSVLLEELLEMVLPLLPPRDLKSAVLVCRYWRKVGERSKFWAWVCLRVTEQNLSVMPHILGIERLKSMKELCMEAVSEELLLQIERHPGLKVLDADDCDMSSIESRGTVGRIVAKLEVVNLDDAILTTQQLEEIFIWASRGDKLKQLSMGGNDLSTVDPKFLGMVVAKLEEVHLDELSPRQCEEIFMFSSRDCKIKKLNMGTKDLSTVDPETLAGVIAQLEVVDLTDTKLTILQCQAIFRFADSDCKMKKLEVGENDLSSVDPETLARVVAKLEVVVLTDTNLIPQQCKTIFRFATNDCKLNKLFMLGNDLSSVDPETLARAVAKLEVVALGISKLIPQQCEAIFRVAAQAHDCKLKLLNMGCNDLSSVSPESLTGVISKLEEVNLCNSKLTPQQCKAIFSLAAGDCELKELFIFCNDLSSVDPEMLAKVVVKLKLDLDETKLTFEQMKSIASCSPKKKLIRNRKPPIRLM